MLADVELRELRVFLTLAEELHFGRTAERLGISQPSVSEAIRLLERRVGTRLFERTSRRVTLTPDGEELSLKLAPIVANLDRTLSEAHDSASPIAGQLRIGATLTTFLPPVHALGTSFLAQHPRCQVSYITVDMQDPFTALRRGRVDVMVSWLAVNEADLTVGPAIGYFDRVLLVGHGHRLAGRESVCLEELAGETVGQPPPTFPASMTDALVPPRTPSGHPIHRRVVQVDGLPNGAYLSNMITLIARGELVHITVRGPIGWEVDAVARVPVADMPPLPLGLFWRTAAEDAKIRALAEVARRNGPWPPAAS